MHCIKLEIDNLGHKLLPGWSVVAATGFLMSLNKPVTMNTLLCQEWGITSEFLDERIQTLLLNSSPVDDVKTIEVRPGDSITLSGAMPGLAGAILRRGGVLADMRHSISARNEEPHETKSKWVTVKLFNLLISDLRSLFLGQGIVLPVDQGLDFLDKLIELEETLYLDGQPAKWDASQQLMTSEEWIKIVVVSV